MKVFLLKEKSRANMKKELEKNFRPKITRVDKSLDKYLETNHFQKKVDKVNEILKIAGLPKFEE